jgi:hypothetical protein
MTETELKQLLESHHWKLHMVKRYQTRYCYAKRRDHKKENGRYFVSSRYLTTERKLSELTPEETLKRIGAVQTSKAGTPGGGEHD